MMTSGRRCGGKKVLKTYVHATTDGLKQGRQALAKIQHIV
jgi:hypothetical protein